MGLQQVAIKAARAAFAAVGDAAATVLYRHVEQGLYDAELDGSNDITTDVVLKIIFDNSALTKGTYNVVEQMTSGNRVAIILSESLSFAPKTGDHIIHGDIEYLITAVTPADPLPNPATYNLLLELVK